MTSQDKKAANVGGSLSQVLMNHPSNDRYGKIEADLTTLEDKTNAKA
jgi:hypothetical protein